MDSFSSGILITLAVEAVHFLILSSIVVGWIAYVMGSRPAQEECWQLAKSAVRSAAGRPSCLLDHRPHGAAVSRDADERTLLERALQAPTMRATIKVYWGSSLDTGQPQFLCSG